MKRMILILLVLVLAAAWLAGRNPGDKEVQPTFPVFIEERPEEPSPETQAPALQTQPPVQETTGNSELGGSWGEQMIRARNYSFPFDMNEPETVELGYTYPLVLDEPLRGCTGFTLEYKIMEIVRGNLEGNFRYEVLVRTLQGEWKSADTFRMDGYSATVEVQLDQPRSVDAVAVVCGKQDEEVTYCFDMAVRNPVN